MGLDFTSALYLGFWHESPSLKPWSRLTLGKPAALLEVPGSEAVARQLARLLGCDQAVLGRSTLHLFWDLFGILAKERITVFQDGGTYSIGEWGIERAAARGVPVVRFPHKDVDSLQRLLQKPGAGRRPVIVTDGICTTCGCTVPLKAYSEIVRRAGGLLVIDDTQALGILGSKQNPKTIYGTGGGGSLRHQNIGGPGVVVISSLTKGFGAPLAVLAGSSDFVRKFKAQSQTRVHCSPPSTADIHAAEHALKLNAQQGDALRFQLAQRVQQFRFQLAGVGISSEGGLFPMQTLRLPAFLDLHQTHQHLLDQGIRTILRHGCDGATHLSMIITACHTTNSIERAVQAIAKTVNKHPSMECQSC